MKYQKGPTKKRTPVATTESAMHAAQIAGEMVSLAEKWLTRKLKYLLLRKRINSILKYLLFINGMLKCLLLRKTDKQDIMLEHLLQLADKPSINR